MYKILALNGGGIRGYLTLKVLDYLERSTGKRISEMFDLVVGTSAGALTGALLDTMSASDIIGYLLYGGKDELFAYNYLSLGGLAGSKYNTFRKEEFIRKVVDKKTTTNFDFGAVSYDTKSSRPVVFNTIDDDNNSKYLLTTKYCLSDAVIASTAAPLFWNPYNIDNMCLIDGAMVANDPTSIAVKLALSEGKDLRDLFILNITTGRNTRTYELGNLFPILWLEPLFRMLMSSQPNATYMFYEAEEVDYTSLDVELSNASDNIDNTSDSNLRKLDLDFEELLKVNKDALEKLVNKL
jgi:predicted acylesterase/phospholipase RssA